MRSIKGGVWLVAVVALLSAACGGNGTVTPDGGGTTDGGTDGGSGAGRRLSVVGPPLVSVQTGTTAQLQVALVQENVGAVAGEVITFQIIGNSADSALGGALTGTAVTDAGGLAAITLNAGMTETTFQVAASAQGANQVAFGVQVIQLQQILQIVRTPTVRVQANGLQAMVDSTAFTKVLLRVRITDQFGNALEGVPVYYSFQTTASSAAFVDAAVTPTTGGGGEAQITLDTGTDLQDTFIITARSDASATATWTVTLQDAAIKLCAGNQDCPQGQYCDGNGICQGVPGCDPTQGIDCPVGYQCSPNNECLPVFGGVCVDDSNCGNGFHCDTTTGACVADNPSCDATNPCPSGFVCNAGACEPVGVIPDISGPWYTEHVFDISGAIPFVADIAGPIRTIDRILVGDFGLPGFIEDIIASVVQQYIPGWVVDLIHVLDVIATLLNELRSMGYMTITQTDGAWTGTEVWESFVFYDLTLCSSIPADPTPPCARVDLFTSGPGVPADLGLKVKPFNGTVSESVVVVNEREAEMRVAKLVGWLVDELIDRFTPYSTLSEALVAVVDCESIGSFVANNSFGLLSESAAEGICNSLVGSVAQTVTDRLYGFAFDLGVLTFHGEANITEMRTTQARELGTANHESTRDGWYDGEFLTSILRDIEGTWRASRRQIP
ncbi:MAG: hypothetical protein P1V51_20325 [Deltaproteobacteria bacterium]|nr:hypothetical protein [Deltaproteobacteria bacterium]